MARMRKLLALVLVMAMTFSLLPVFAAADEAPAVETVAEISEAPAQTPVAEAIDTVAAEPVAPKAELQAEYASDAEAIAAGMVMRWDGGDGTTAYYDNPKTAVKDASTACGTSSSKGGVLRLLRDYTYIDTSSGSANPWMEYSKNQLNAYTGEDGISIYGFWLDLGGHTLTYKGAHPMIGRGGVASVNVRNGKMIYRNSGRTGVAIGMVVTGVTSTGPYSGGFLISRFTAKDAELYSLFNTSGTSDSNHRNAVFTSTLWTNQVNLYNSKAIAVDSNAVRFNKSKATISGTDLTKYQQAGAVSEVHLHEGSVLGSIGSFASVLYTRISGGTETGIEHKLIITADSENDIFLGTNLRSSSGITPTFVDPEGQANATTCSVAMPDPATITATALDAAPGYLAAAEYSALYYAPHTHVIVFVEETQPTYTEPGMVEHYVCEGCGKLFYDEAGESEVVDLEDLLIPKLDCSHEAELEHHDAVPATYAAAGVTEYWTCPICQQKFSDAEGQTAVEDAALETPKLTDATGKTDAELVELGAVMKATAPDGAETAYNTIQAAINLANTWDAPGGVIRLLVDYTLFNDTNTSTRYYEIAAKTNTYHGMDETIGDELYGYWIDLGGHTLTAICQRPFLGSTNASAVNIRNGRLIYHNATGSTGAIKGAIAFGISTTAPYSSNSDPATLQTGRVTIANAEIIGTAATGDGGNCKDVIMSSLWSNVVRLYDAKVIARYGIGVYFYLSNANPTGAALTDIQSRGVQDVVELHGNSVCGSMNSSSNAVGYRSFESNSKPDDYAGTYEGIDHVVTVTADAGCKFLGKGLVADYSGAKYALTVVPPEGEMNDNLIYSFARPDTTSYVTASTIGAVPTFLDAADCIGLYYGEHVHYSVHHPATEATYEADGNVEYWSCGCGKVWLDADLTQETTIEAVTIAMQTCTHEGLEHHEGTPATYAHDGTQEYWSCPSCGKLFSDETCTAVMEESAIAIAKLVDATGKTDDELVALDAVVKAVAPDGTAKAYDNVKSGYVEAKKWTEVGGSLVLLKDFTQDDVYTLSGSENNGNTGYLSVGYLPTDASYDNAADVPEMPTKGFWFDLGGHTLTFTSDRSMYYLSSTAYVNIKNGTLIFQSDSRGECTMYGIVSCGWTGNQPASDSAPYTPTVNLYDLECYTVDATNSEGKAKNENPAIVGTYILNTTVNIRDSKVIAATNQPAIEYYHPKGTSAAALAVMQGAGVQFTVSVTNSVFGSLDADKPAVLLADQSAAPNGGLTGVAYTANITADKASTILGNELLRNTSTAPYAVNVPEFFRATKNFAFPAIEREAADYGAWVDISALSDATAETAAATVTTGENTIYFAELGEAVSYAELFGRKESSAVTLTLNADASSPIAIGEEGKTSAFTLDLNGKALPEDGLFIPDGGAGTKVTITLTGEGPRSVKLFYALSAVPFTNGGEYVIEKGSLFTDYSLNLADNIEINLYTKDATGVGYAQNDAAYTIDAADEKGAWIIDTIAAKQMAEPIDAYAVKTDGAQVKVDFTKNISVKSYVDGDPAAELPDGDMKTALAATLKTLLVYGKYAEKSFNSDYTDLTAEELASIGLEAIPETDTSNLTDADYVVTEMNDLHFAAEGVGFYGAVADPAAGMSLTFYFLGDVFDGKTATVNGEDTELGTFGDYKTVEVGVRARNFNTPVTVVIDGVGSVTDSMSGYTSRMTDEHTVKLAQALRAYGADAMRYAAAKDAAEQG